MMEIWEINDTHCQMPKLVLIKNSKSGIQTSILEMECKLFGVKDLTEKQLKYSPSTKNKHAMTSEHSIEKGK